MGGSDQNDVGSAADPIPYEILFVFIYFLVPEADYSELILTLGRQDQLVYIFKGLIKGQLVVLVLVGLEFGELPDEYFAEELADFESWVRGRYLRGHRRRQKGSGPCQYRVRGWPHLPCSFASLSESALPCISADTKAMPCFSPFLVFLSFLGVYR